MQACAKVEEMFDEAELQTSRDWRNEIMMFGIKGKLLQC